MTYTHFPTPLSRFDRIITVPPDGVIVTVTKQVLDSFGSTLGLVPAQVIARAVGDALGRYDYTQLATTNARGTHDLDLMFRAAAQVSLRVAPSLGVAADQLAVDALQGTLDSVYAGLGIDYHVIPVHSTPLPPVVGRS